MELGSPQAILERAGRCPVVSVTAVLAVGLTLMSWQGRDLSPLWWPRGEPLDTLRLVGSVYLHGGILHLLFNLYWLVAFGLRLEERLGSAKFLGIFLLLAVGSSAWQILIEGPGIGLSGVGYGMFGLLWALDRWDVRWRGAMDRETVRLFVGWFFLCIVTTWTGFMNVANTAHGSGALLGGLAGMALARRAPGKRIAAGVAGGVLVLLGAGAILTGRVGWLRGVPGWAIAAGSIERDLAEDRPEESLRRADLALREWPDIARLHYLRGCALESLHRPLQARDAYGTAARLDPAEPAYAAARDRGRGAPPAGETGR